MLQEKLKEATKPNHDRLEHLMFVNDIMSGQLSVEQYKQILLTNFAVHQALEDKIFSALSPETGAQLSIATRAKLKALQADMNEVGLDEAVEYSVESDPSIYENQAAALGALYVMEGATLGGNVIVKRLKLNPNFTHLNLGFHYYQVYGEQLIPSWKQFCEVLNKQPETTWNDSVDAAKKMFALIAETASGILTKSVDPEVSI